MKILDFNRVWDYIFDVHIRYNIYKTGWYRINMKDYSVHKTGAYDMSFSGYSLLCDKSLIRNILSSWFEYYIKHKL